MTLHEMKQDLVRYGKIVRMEDLEVFGVHYREYTITYEDKEYEVEMRNGVTYRIEMVLEK